MFPARSQTEPVAGLWQSQNGGHYPDSRLSTLFLRPLSGSPSLHKHMSPQNGMVRFTSVSFTALGNSTRRKDGKDG